MFYTPPPLSKKPSQDGSAILDVAGRDQQDQRMYLTKDRERLVWELERLETEPWVEPPDPVLEAVAALVTADRPAWGGTATELAAAIQLSKKLSQPSRSSRLGWFQGEGDTSPGVAPAVLIADVVLRRQPPGPDIQPHRQGVGLHVGLDSRRQLRGGAASTPAPS